MTPVTDPHTLKRELEMSERRRLTLKRRMVLDSLDPEDNSLWTMLDLITLLLVFFIVLYNNSLPQVLNREVPRVQKRVPAPSRLLVERDPRLSRLQDRLDRMMLSSRLSDYKTLLEDDRVRLVIGERISFESGKAKLIEHIKPALVNLTSILNEERGLRIAVAGHTDNTPIHTEAFPSNWELSLARALGVGKFLMASGVDPARVSIEGFGEFQPVADNRDPLSRGANRRVEISLILSR